MEEEIEHFGPCYMCASEEVFAYSRWRCVGSSKPKLNYTFIQCDNCRTVSKNTTDTFTWEQVVEEWKSRGVER